MNRIWRCVFGIRLILKNDSVVLIDITIDAMSINCTLNVRRIVGAKRNYPTDNSR
jgi:hypothetical protein